jgi:hypothetical protein
VSCQSHLASCSIVDASHFKPQPGPWLLTAMSRMTGTKGDAQQRHRTSTVTFPGVGSPGTRMLPDVSVGGRAHVS